MTNQKRKLFLNLSHEYKVKQCFPYIHYLMRRLSQPLKNLELGATHPTYHTLTLTWTQATRCDHSAS